MLKKTYLLFIAVGVSVLFVLVAIFQNKSIPKSQITKPDQCISCHSGMSDIDQAHPKEIFGCASCHGGNKFATDKIDAHQGIVLNPASLDHAPLFCGKCHESIIKRVSMSIMNTQSGILNVLKYQWSESKDLNSTIGVQDIRGIINTSSMAESHFRKLCAACHVNQDPKIFQNQKIARGGGCSDCHKVSDTKGLHHATFSSVIPIQNCTKCHNRSNRIGLAYQGIFESEGYGTPYKLGKFTHKMNDGRFFYPLPADIHHSKAEMSCIDCHSEKGVMGDGHKHFHMEDAEDVKCKDCHKPHFAPSDSLAQTLSDLNGHVPESKMIAYTLRKHAPLYHVQKDHDKAVMYRKKDGKKFDMTMMSDNPYHTLAIHKRLDCSACHSPIAPSCYGCHEVYFDKGKQFDWVEKKVTPGQWQELRSFLRFEEPSLGVGYNKKIMPFAPGCQVIGTLFKDKKIEKFHSLAMAGWDPHTTQKKSRTCVDCHFKPASLGLGRGNLDIKKGQIEFEPFYDSKKSGQPVSYPLDSFVSKEGKQFQSTSRKYARSFNKKELHRIIGAYKCIICHDTYSDPVYVDFNRSKKLFDSGKTSCFKK